MEVTVKKTDENVPMEEQDVVSKDLDGLESDPSLFERSKRGSKVALVSVVGGSRTKEQVVSQLQRVVTAKWKWEPVDYEANSFIVPFPSKLELQRAIAYGGADVKEWGVFTGARLQFEKWHEKEEGFLLPKSLDVVIGDHYFELKFEVERLGFDENGEEVEIERDDENEDGSEEKEGGDDTGERRDPKKAKSDDIVVDEEDKGAAI
ncbi:hypothetical protein E2562_035548 [Oryza meyeriana var. granulata]|uniref:DUF4283 domain-containing protein n=1 Tax=Oryza meyeriana var. granulata TaxID=110450 RepID=A0A6G1DSC0_9ORYZ|nr:hypothetical protein E2562_035548 [Oryza meyeriana var. granulata]